MAQKTPGGSSRPRGPRVKAAPNPASRGSRAGTRRGGPGAAPSTGSGSGTGTGAGSGSRGRSGTGSARRSDQGRNSSPASPAAAGRGDRRPPRRDDRTDRTSRTSRTDRTDRTERPSNAGRRRGPDGAPARARATTAGTGGRRPQDDRRPVVRKGWGSVARRGASAVRDGDAAHGPDHDTPEGRRRARGRSDEFVPERFVRVDERETRPPGRAAAADRPAPRRTRARIDVAPELPPDVAAELATAAGPDWGVLAPRITERMAAGIGAFERERYRDASRILKVVADAVPNAPSARELLGLAQYRQGYWKAALGNLEVFAQLTGSVDQHPVRMDCQRALGRPKKVQLLWEELRKGSPDTEVLSEGRLVLAATMADAGDLAGAIALLVEAGAGRLVRSPAERHLRQWYVLADLCDRGGDAPKARELFQRIRAVDPDAYDVTERLAALGVAPRSRPRRPPKDRAGSR